MGWIEQIVVNGLRWVGNVSPYAVPWITIYPSRFVQGPAQYPPDCDEHTRQAIDKMVGIYLPQTSS
jgi:hypothetical protein